MLAQRNENGYCVLLEKEKKRLGECILFEEMYLNVIKRLENLLPLSEMVKNVSGQMYSLFRIKFVFIFD